METLVGLFVLTVLPWIALWHAVRHGPFANRYWLGETVLGFALVVGGVAFLAGFVGPIVFTPEANQGPLLGIFFTGPAGFVAGLVWGAMRAMARRQRDGEGG